MRQPIRVGLVLLLILWFWPVANGHMCGLFSMQ